MAVCCICDIKFGFQAECVSFHRFPKDENKRVHWFAAIDEKVQNFTFIPNSQICSQHFTMECFVITCSGKRYLKTDAVPSVFDIPLKQGLKLIQPVQQLYAQKCDNVVNMSHKLEEKEREREIRISKKIKSINNKYLCKSDLTKAASILKNNTNIGISHSVSLSTSAVHNTGEMTDLRHAREYIETLKKKLKVSQQKCRRLQTRVTFLKLLVKHLQNKK